jgi:hypothetical protein
MKDERGCPPGADRGINRRAVSSDQEDGGIAIRTARVCGTRTCRAQAGLAEPFLQIHLQHPQPVVPRP